MKSFNSKPMASKGHSTEEEQILDELSRWLAPILRDPEKARKKGLERDQDGWAKLEEVEKILRRSRLQQHVGQLRRMLKWSKYDRGREAGQPRFIVQTWNDDEYIRPYKKVLIEDNVPRWSAMVVGEESEGAREDIRASPAPAPAMPAAPAAPQAADAAAAKAAAFAPAEKPQPESPIRFPQLVYPKIVEMLKQVKDMGQCMSVSKEWNEGVAKPVKELMACEGCKEEGNWKQVKLPCGHRVCGLCHQNSRACALCGKLARDTGDFSPLNLNDNPRSSVCPDSASATWSTANSAQNPYKWICSDDDEVKDPFTDEELRLRESVGQWFPLPPENSRNEPVTRYCAFYTFCDKVIARVFCLPDGMTFKRPNLKVIEARSFYAADSRPSANEAEAVRDILKNEVRQSPSNEAGGRRTRWRHKSQGR